MYELTEGEALVLCSSDSQIAKEVREHISFEGVEVEGCVIGPSGGMVYFISYLFIFIQYIFNFNFLCC